MCPEVRIQNRRGGKPDIYITILPGEIPSEVLGSPEVQKINELRRGLPRTGFREKNIPWVKEVLNPILGEGNADLFVRALMNNEKVSFYFDIHTK